SISLYHFFFPLRIRHTRSKRDWSSDVCSSDLVQLLWINLVTDTLTAIALGVETVEPGIMKNKPRGRKSNFFSGGVASSIIYQGILEGILVLGAYQLGLHVGPQIGRAHV